VWYTFAMKTYQANTVGSREELELLVESDLGKTTEKKDAIIVGTTEELLKLKLSHGQTVWGVEVEASDYQPIADQPRPMRGELHKSAINYFNENNESSNRGKGK